MREDQRITDDGSAYVALLEATEPPRTDDSQRVCRAVREARLLAGPVAPIIVGIWAWRAWRAYGAAMTAAELAELEAEPCYSASSRAAYLGRPPTRPQRIGALFPFWPRPRGSLAPDLVIAEYRQQPFEVPNVYAAVEVKFPGDWIRRVQLRDYSDLMRTEEKVAVMRVPEDCTDATPGDRDRVGQGRCQAEGGRDEYRGSVTH